MTGEDTGHQAMPLNMPEHDAPRGQEEDVTSTAQVGAELWQADDLWRSTIGSIGEAVWVADRDLRILLFSDVARDWCRALGVPVASPVGRYLGEVFPFLEERVFDEYREVTRTGRPLTTTEVTWLGGRAVTTETRKIPLVENGEVQRVITVIRDITEQARVLEHAVLRRDLAQGLLAAETVDEALSVWQEAVLRATQADVVAVFLDKGDPPGLRLAHSRGLKTAPPDHVVSPPPGSFWHRMLYCPEPAYMDVGDVPDGQSTYLASEGLTGGAHIPVLCRGELIAACEVGWRSPAPTSEEMRRRIEAMAAELGGTLARIRAVDSLKKSEERLELALSCPGFGLWDYDVAAMRAYPSPALVELLAGRVEECGETGRWWEGIEFHEDDVGEFAGRLWPQIVSGQREDYDYEVRVRGSDGEWHWLRTRGHVAARDAEGKPARIVVVVLDITEQREADERRRQLEVRTQKLEGLSVMAGGIAHDFSNILQAVLGHVQNALDNTPAEAATRDSLEGIHEAAIRASELSRQMLAYAGRASLESEPVSFAALAGEMMSLLKASISKKAELLCALPGGPCTVLGDATQLRQVLLNLVTNASDALEDRPGTIRLEVGEADAWPTALSSLPSGTGPVEGPAVFLRVEDTGCGMDEDALSRMFDPFFTTKPNGRGLGLAAVLGIVQKHNGAVMVDSSVGAGTSIQVWLPASQGAVAPRPAPPSDAALTRPSSAGTVLLVDDEPGIRDTMRALLESRGYTVLTAADGIEAVEVFGGRHEEIGAVLMDLRMPRMSGEEALAEMRLISPATPVIAVTAVGEPSGPSDLAASGFAMVIHKPVVIGDLLPRLEAVMRE